LTEIENGLNYFTMKRTTLAKLEEKAVFKGQFSCSAILYFFDKEMKEIGYSIQPICLKPDLSYEFEGRTWDLDLLNLLEITALVKPEFRKSIIYTVYVDIKAEDRETLGDMENGAEIAIRSMVKRFENTKGFVSDFDVKS
jgi:hypothetical protein